MYRQALRLWSTRTPIDMTSWFGTQRSATIPSSVSASASDREIAEQLDLWMALIGPTLEQLCTEPARSHLERRWICDDGGTLRNAAVAASVKRLRADHALTSTVTWLSKHRRKIHVGCWISDQVCR